MRVLLDISWLGLGHLSTDSRGGVYRVHHQLTETLAERSDCELLLCANCSSLAFEGCRDYLRTSTRLAGLPLLGPSSAPGAWVRRLSARAHGTARRLIGRRPLPLAFKAGARLVEQRVNAPVSDATPGVDLFHSLGAPLPPRTPRGPRRLLSVYDHLHPRYARLYDRHRVQAQGQTVGSLGPEDWVITTSQSTRADLAETGVVAEERVFVTTLAADRTLFYPCSDEGSVVRLKERLGIPTGPYFLALGLAFPRKNTQCLVRAFTRLVRQERAHDLSLVLAGYGGPGQGLEGALADAAASGARVILAGYVPDEDLAALFSGALAFLYPSLHEGFGLPLVEAMQCGAPVIASDCSSISEVAGDAACLVGPPDEEGLAQAMLDLYRSESLQERMRAKSLARAAEFSWARCADETLAAYRAVLAA